MEKLRDTFHEQSKRLHGLDLLKLGFVVTIVIFHVWEVIIYQDLMELPLSRSFYTIYGLILSALFHYAGPFLAGLSFFLYGYRNSKFSLAKFIVLILGVLIMQYSSESLSDFAKVSSWAWDVYSYLVVAYLFVFAMPRQTNIQIFSLGISLIALLIPVQVYTTQFPALQQIRPEMLVMNPVSQVPNGWFLLPWIFLPIGLSNLGVLVSRFENRLERFQKWEAGLWIIAFVGWIIPFETTKFLAGPRFYEFVFWPQLSNFWFHLTLLLFFIRLQFFPPVRSFFNRRVFQWISKLQWVRNLWLCYLLHYAFVETIAEFYTVKKNEPFALDLLWILIFIGTEIFVQILMLIRKKKTILGL